MLSESFALNRKEFEQIFTYDESVFVLWDSDNNGKNIQSNFAVGLVDCIEFICGLTIFSNCRVEDKIRFLFEFFDMNDNNYLEECDLQFMFLSTINAVAKLFAFTNEAEKEAVFNFMCKFTLQSFPEGMKVTISEMLKWGTTALEFKEFFTLVELYNQKNPQQVLT